MLLVVEDEVLARRALTLLLNSRGFEAAGAGSAEQALEWIARGHLPDRAVIDLDLPGMNGAELIRRLARICPLVHPILVSAATPEHIRDCLGNLQIPMLRKPINIRLLVGMLRQLGRDVPPEAQTVRGRRDPGGSMATMHA